MIDWGQKAGNQEKKMKLRIKQRVENELGVGDQLDLNRNLEYVRGRLGSRDWKGSPRCPRSKEDDWLKTGRQVRTQKTPILTGIRVNTQRNSQGPVSRQKSNGRMEQQDLNGTKSDEISTEISMRKASFTHVQKFHKSKNKL